MNLEALVSYPSCEAVIRSPSSGAITMPWPEGERLGLGVQLYKLSDDPHERRNLAALSLAETTDADATMLR